jgi:hypothetical protein
VTEQSTDGEESIGGRGLWKLRDDGATGGAHEARKGTGTNAGSELKSEPGASVFALHRPVGRAGPLSDLDHVLVFSFVKLRYFKFDKYFSRKKHNFIFKI